MAQTLGQFSRRMRKRADSISEEIRKLVAKTALLADQVLVLSTPVDTGLARSNWLPSLGSPRIGAVIPPYNPYPAYTDPTKFNERANAEAAINAARLTVAARRRSEEDIFFTNNVEYITKLNNGTSSQAPAGFVQLAVEAAAAAIRQSSGTIVKENL